ncbi:MAG: hypothetical protein ACRCXV_09340, partial [Bacteroidales bacterium]
LEYKTKAYMHFPLSYLYEKLSVCSSDLEILISDMNKCSTLIEDKKKELVYLNDEIERINALFYISDKYEAFMNINNSIGILNAEISVLIDVIEKLKTKE